MMGKLIKKSESWIVSSFDGREYPINPYHNYRFNNYELNVLDLYNKEIQFRVEFMWGTCMEKTIQVAIIDEI